MPSSPLASMLSAAESYYGLAAPAFSLTPDPRFVYHSRSHARAIEDVRLALRRREGLIVVTGDIGIGKTVLCRTLLEQFEPRTFLSVVLDPKLGVEDLLQQVLVDFGLMSAAEPGRRGPIDRHQLVSTLQRFLGTLIPLDAHAVIMIDEAQHLDPAVLEEIRLWSNIETDQAKLLQIVLVGQPDLEDLLSRRELRQVTQRVARRITLQPLSPREVQQYIEHRLRVARGDHREPADEVALPEGRDGAALDEAGVRFTPPAMRAIVMASGGLPRVINLLCQKALEIGSERGRRAIDHRVVAAAARDLNLPIASTVPGPRAVAATVAALAVLAAGTVWWWLSATPPTTAPASTSPPVPAAPPSAIGPPPPPQTAPSSVTSPAGPDAAVVTTAASAPASDAPSALTPRYTIAVASFRTAERAEEVAAQVGALDLPVFTRFDEASGWHQIVVGPYGATAEALTAQERLTSSGFPGTRITASNASPAAAIPITP